MLYFWSPLKKQQLPGTQWILSYTSKVMNTDSAEIEHLLQFIGFIVILHILNFRLHNIAHVGFHRRRSTA